MSDIHEHCRDFVTAAMAYREAVEAREHHDSEERYRAYLAAGEQLDREYWVLTSEHGILSETAEQPQEFARLAALEAAVDAFLADACVVEGGPLPQGEQFIEMDDYGLLDRLQEAREGRES